MNTKATRARIAKTNAVRDENATLAAESDAREIACEAERANTRGPRLQFTLVDGLISKQVDERIALGRRAGDVGHRTVAFYLADCADRGLFQDLGHASAISYAVRRHHLSRRHARDLIAAGRALRDLPKIDAAFFQNRIAWCKVRAIARVADRSTEDQWLAFALSHTTDEVEKESALAKRGEKPREERKGLPEIRFDVRLRVGALVHEQILLARQKMSADAGHAVSDEEFAGLLAESFLRKPTEGMPSSASDSLYRVVLDLRHADGTATLRSEDGPVQIGAAMAAAVACDAGVVTEEGHAHEHAPPIPERLRRRILARDGHRCLVCRRGRRFQVHHIRWRSEKGSNDWGNLMTLCVRCHELVHQGLLSIAGKAPGNLVFRDRAGELLDDPARIVGSGDARALQVALALPETTSSAPEALSSSAPASAAPSTACPTPEGGGARAPSNSGFTAEKQGALPTQFAPAPLAHATLPTHRVDRDWVARHKHLIRFSRERSGFELQDGIPLAAAPVRRPISDPGAPAGGGASESRDALRPHGFAEVVGQPKAVERLRVYAESARVSGRKPAPVLLLGDPGVGKTTLARAYARELGARLETVDSSVVHDPFDLVSRVLDLEDGDVIFLDEIHALPRLAAECLYPAIEDGLLHLPFVEGVAIRTLELALPKVTFVAATTNPESVPAPLLTRFRTIELSPYGTDDLVEIVLRAAGRDGVAVDRDAAAIVAKASCGAARAVIGLYLDLRTMCERRRGSSASVEDARAALDAAEIDENGIGPRHERILDVLRRHRRPLGVTRLASEAGLTEKAYRTLYEPALIRARAIVPTRWGVRLGSGAPAVRCA